MRADKLIQFLSGDMSAFDIDEMRLHERLQEWHSAETQAEINLAEELLMAEIAGCVASATERAHALAAHFEQAELTGGPTDHDIQRMERSARHLRSLSSVLAMLLDEDSQAEIILDGGDQ